MHRPPGNLTLIPLLDGRVLAFGTWWPDPSDQVANVELFDSASGSWTEVAGFPGGPNTFGTATRLLDGRVLVTYSSDRGGDEAPLRATVYDPGAGTWTTTATQLGSHGGGTATALHDGRVLVAGGYNGQRADQSSAELYDPALGTWTATASMTEGRYGHSATPLPDGRVLVIGGYNTPRSAELYDPGTGAP
jgi:N-acetylneuraminic acid mutarotase